MKTAARSSFRLRLALQTMLVAGVVVAAFGVGAWWYAREQQARNQDLRITDEARRLWTQLTPRHREADFADAMRSTFGEGVAALRLIVVSHATGNRVLFSSSGTVSNADRASLAQRLPTGPSVVTQAIDAEIPQRQARARSPAVASSGTQRHPVMPEIRAPSFFTMRDATGEWRFGTFSNPHYTVFAGLPMSELYAESQHSAVWFTCAGAAALLLAGLGAWWASGRAMRPLDRVVSTASKMGTGNLDERIPLLANDDREFAQLIATLNDMTARLQASFQQAARFTADASHELKTPLAVMQSTLSDTLREGSLDDATRERVEAMLEQTSRLKHITQSLLLLSQAEAGKLPVSRERYDLSADLEGLIEDAASLCEHAALKLEQSIDPGIWIEADRALMQQVFRNLLSNAIKHNRPGGSVSILLTRVDGRADFVIANTCAGLASVEKARLFERFYRADAARGSEGFGLGLNIALELARVNGLELRLADANTERVVFSISMPLASEGPASGLNDGSESRRPSGRAAL
ncbi:MAG: HAMP domain-containing histidine kinase [Verrucomicrobiaceae bacterium]|nr:HAMP domain-containing histidine kinase [Verrucomicrobiaceae bacterium]